PTVRNQEIVMEFDSAESAQKAKSRILADYTNLVVMTDSGSTLEARFNDVYINDFKAKTLEQAIETIRNRVDEFGVAEPSITAQGSDRILVQLPGVEDSASAKELINKTAKLEFLTVEKPPAEL